MFGWFKSKSAPPAPKVDKPAPSRESFFSTDIPVNDLLDDEQRRANLMARLTRVSKIPVLKEVVAADGAIGFAQDYEDCGSDLKGTFDGGFGTVPDAQLMWYGSQGFIGYQLCALIAQHWLVNKACYVPARDAIRKGYKFTNVGEQKLDPEVLARIEAGNDRYRLNRNLQEFVYKARIFGIRIALFKIDSDDPDFYVKPFNADAIKPGTYRGISQIDPFWITPELTSRAASDPAAIDFYEPTYWLLNGQRIHKSHLVVMRGPDVADIYKPAYLFGGLSVPQMIYERVYAAERTANETPQLALSKRSMVFYTDIAQAMASIDKFTGNLLKWARFRDNFGVKVADKEADQIEQHDTSLADMDTAIMTQYQLVASIANVPATKLLGTQPKGFNSTGEYEADSYREELESIQTNDLLPLINRHMVCMIRSDIGDPSLRVRCVFNPLSSMTDQELATTNKTKAETDKLYADMGAITPDEVRARISADEFSGHNGLPVLSDQDALIPTDPQA